ncbi:MAG: hypothetical protein WC136_00410 [Sphaerochaeta sp.]|jgi:hypothetical protein
MDKDLILTYFKSNDVISMSIHILEHKLSILEIIYNMEDSVDEQQFDYFMHKVSDNILGSLYETSYTSELIELNIPHKPKEIAC